MRSGSSREFSRTHRQPAQCAACSAEILPSPPTCATTGVQCPQPAQGWHRDGGSIYTPRLDYLQVFYYPQDTPPELGPTEMIPGSHFMRSKSNYMGHIRNVKVAKTTAAPAGSIFITVYSIWHRKGKSNASGPSPPHQIQLLAHHGTTSRLDRPILASTSPGQVSPIFPTSSNSGAASPRAEMFCWLSGEAYEHQGGQCWPCESPVKPHYEQEGLPPGLSRSNSPAPKSGRATP